jgi:16S rRNA (cytosine1402-N4)-methyltransferase
MSVKEHQHIPVLYKEILDFLLPVLQQPLAYNGEPKYFDGTFGRGGHLRKIYEQVPGVSAVAFDRDATAIAFGKESFAEQIQEKKLTLVQDNFANFKNHNLNGFDAMLIDLGVSSPQLDQAERGFSFYHDGPLDMRMDNTTGWSAADIIAQYSEEELIQVFTELGEIHRPFRVVRAIVHDRKEKPFTTTRQLASLIERVEGWRKKGFHPATQFFMALRLKVNEELDAVSQAIEPLILGLRPGGRLAVLTFHSLEDRIVKNIFKERTDLGLALTKKVIQASREEEKENPRSRSAKLRVFERSM